ncbi:MAG: L-2-amino-thiazoline-4-carboxylic acid hydrolase [Erysipelotrichaceae bacterium]|nr:L-2-amino-thiazoline-4-carboxylic acid hydrolase [Erysipelotrichaceae bacterium]
MKKIDEKLELEEVDMYVLFARMFADITKEVEVRFGQEGLDAIREGVRQFGLKRGQNIAARAQAMGHEISPEFYLSCYDMGRSDYFTSDDKVSKERVEQDFTQCVFADTWTKDGTQKYGIHYCEMIDPAIAEGYCSNFKCIHDKHFFKDGMCHFVFEMDQKDKE